MTTLAAAAREEGVWEICNEDGFVYKRRKRRGGQQEDDLEAAADHHPGADHQLRQQNKKKKTRLLMKLRDQYQREIHQWERLSNTLPEMDQERTQIQLLLNQKPSSFLMVDSALPKPLQMSDDFVCQKLLLDQLLLQAESQEAIIQDFSNLCDVAESMCKAEEECLRQSLINDLPIWASPRSILASLSDENLLL
ncbi:hypothetical protein BVC80_1065g148 [Macleaya cordata]|uniref:Uncharacterized protein n=1 Tax=Macleaya cordata TaxID=56857 RepID=A0A200RD08_MACCD|nr:hypothetical protein BVC80_1065g148 [Macleaya cordata]